MQSSQIVLNIDIPVIILFIITLLAIGACFFLIGYLYGSKSGSGVYIDNNKGFFSKQENRKSNTITIDDKKIVTKINTDNLEKKYDSLGEKKESQENIGESVNKLKNLKK